MERDKQCWSIGKKSLSLVVWTPDLELLLLPFEWRTSGLVKIYTPRLNHIP
jgi:hypothetical protein